MPQKEQRFFIKFIKWLLILSLLLPVHVNAQKEIKIEYQTIKKEALYRPSDEVVENLFAAYKITQAKLQVKKTYYGYCSCVTYLKAFYGITYSIGAAHNWPVNAKIGAVGGVIVFSGKIGHVARIVAISVNGYVVDEANYISCSHTTGRVVAFNDRTILGFWNP